MILSKYILSEPIGSGRGTILYNPLRDSLIVSEKDDYANLQKLADDIEKNRIAPEEYDVLKDEGFLIEEPEKDYEESCRIFKKYQNDTESLNITFLPTYACNFSCSYCFESKIENKKTIENRTLMQLILWVRKKLEEVEPKDLNILFFGGEPLLCKKEILAVSKELNKTAMLKGIKLNIDIITNGYLVDEKTISELSGYGLNNIKITLDGTESFHDKKRMLKNGAPTFKRIISNLLKVKDKCDILIGVNFDDENRDGINSLIDYIRSSKLKDSISNVSIKHIMNDGSDREGLSCHKTVEEFKSSLGFVRYAKKCGFNIFDRVNLGPCDANRSSSFTIDPYGDLYLCPASVGKKDLKVGSVFKDRFDEKYEKFVKANPLEDKKCSGCKYLPMCFGGCRLISYYKNNDFNGINCEKEYFKTIAPALLKLEIEDNILGNV